MKAPRRLLIRGVNWLGDAVMTTPALLRIRDAHPQARISLATPEKFADLWQSHTAVDQVFPLKAGESPVSVSRRLRPEKFDTALVLPNSPRSALECFLAGIPTRVGYRRAWRSWFLTHAIASRSASVAMVKPTVAEVRNRLREAVPHRQSIDPQAHHSLDYLHLAAVLGANPAPVPPRLFVTNTEVQQARSRFGVDANQVWCGLNPGAEYGPAKRWPADRFAEVARRISESQPVRWILFGGARDVAVAADIASAVGGALNVAGQTSLRELMALLSVCRVVLTNDTGPMHVAAALGVPVVVPFGSTSVELTGPGLPGDSRHRFLQAPVSCAPCFLRECPVDFRCMTSITVEMAIAELAEAMRGPISRSAGGTNPAR